jgi:hypothetical protein
MSQDPQSRLYDRLHRSPAPAVKQRDIWDKVQAVSSLSSCDASCPSSTIWTPLSAFCKPAWGTTNQKKRPISSRPRSHKYHDAAASISPPLPAAVASALGGIVDLQAYQRNHKSEELLSARALQCRDTQPGRQPWLPHLPAATVARGFARSHR